ncbi:MAG TPA: hypothetical protein VN442_12470 [Bryobacteraceae bacterium]|nr:hypothetical protein [Bryobacteraceae bacterium]
MPTNPFSVSSMAACPQASAPKPPTDILIIGDNPTLGVYLSGLFQQPGWTIADTRSCATGTEFLRNRRAAVAVCEEVLPDGSWHDVSAALNSVPDAPALIVVGNDQAVVQEVLSFGGFDALVRPLRESDVVWAIASAWDSWMKRFEAGGKGAPQCPGA